MMCFLILVFDIEHQLFNIGRVSFVPKLLGSEAPRIQSGCNKLNHHSFLNDSTGLATAARIACQLTVANAITTAANPARANIHHSTSIR